MTRPEEPNHNHIVPEPVWQKLSADAQLILGKFLSEDTGFRDVFSSVYPDTDTLQPDAPPSLRTPEATATEDSAPFIKLPANLAGWLLRPANFDGEKLPNMFVASKPDAPIAAQQTDKSSPNNGVLPTTASIPQQESPQGSLNPTQHSDNVRTSTARLAKVFELPTELTARSAQRDKYGYVFNCVGDYRIHPLDTTTGKQIALMASILGAGRHKSSPKVTDLDPRDNDTALCAQTDPEIFFPEKGGSTRAAKQICRGCELRAQCLTYAVENDERYGIWGGLSERERRRPK
jgi:WhiB family redox-sensing transcriptional regulator